MNKGRNVFWGLIFILGAMAMLVSRLGFFGADINFWHIVFSIALVGSLIDGIWHKNFWVILFSAAFLIIINDKLLGLESITPWPVLGAALFGSIGLGFLFPDNNWKKAPHVESGNWGSSDKSAGVGSYATVDANGEAWFDNTFGETVKYLNNNEISAVHVKNTFGELSLYLTDAILKDGKATIQVNNSFGAVNIYVPKDWRVNKDVRASFGDASEKGQNTGLSENTLYIRGSVSFGEVAIYYV